jgi:hypothetical protein
LTTRHRCHHRGQSASRAQGNEDTDQPAHAGHRVCRGLDRSVCGCVVPSGLLCSTNSRDSRPSWALKQHAGLETFRLVGFPIHGRQFCFILQAQLARTSTLNSCAHSCAMDSGCSRCSVCHSTSWM